MIFNLAELSTWWLSQIFIHVGLFFIKIYNACILTHVIYKKENYVTLRGLITPCNQKRKIPKEEF